MKNILCAPWRLSPILAITMALALSYHETRADETVPPQPALQLLPTHTVDLGSIHSYVITNLSFKIRNNGAAPLLIERLVPTCPCILGKLDKVEIPAGEEASLRVALDASQVHGLFKRALWVHSNDPKSPHVAVVFTGEVIPLFSGLPEKMISWTIEDYGVAITNHFTLSATEKILSLGEPKVETLGDLQGTLTLTTNLAETTSYHLTTIFTPLANGRHSAIVTLPVIGRKNAKPLEIFYRVIAGAELMTVPRQIVLMPNERAQTFRLVIRTQGNTPLEPEDLTWEPVLQGLEITALKQTRGRRKTDLSITGKITPTAARTLLAADVPEINFFYPDHKQATVAVSVDKAPSASLQP